VRKRLRWLAADCGSLDHPMNTIVRQWMPRQAKEADAHFRRKYGRPLADVLTDDQYQMMHIELFPHGIIHAECIGGDVDLLLNQRVTIGCFPWRFVDGEASIARVVAFLEDRQYARLMAKKAKLPKTKWGDAIGCRGPRESGPSTGFRPARTSRR